MRARRPAIAATASKRRPTLVVGGDAVPVPAISATASQLRGSTSCARASGIGGGVSPAAASHAHAIRQGSRTAASPPGSRTGKRSPTRSYPAQVAGQDLAAPDRAVGPVSGAVEDGADRRLGYAVLRKAGGQVGVVVLDGDALDALPLERIAGRQVVGMEVVGDEGRLDGEQPLEVLDALAE